MPDSADEGASRRSLRKSDARLVERILAGDTDAWHFFVDTYSRLILKVLREHLFGEDEDETQGVYVEVLRELHGGRLADYKPKAALSTWLVLVTRSRALDHLRATHGRRRLPTGYAALTPFEQRLYQLFFVEGLSFDAIRHSVNWQDDSVSAEDIANGVLRIEEVVDSRTLVRLRHEREARRAGVRSARQLAYLLHARENYRSLGEASAKETVRRLEKAEFQEGIDRISERFEPEERQVLKLRFEEGLSATEIASHVDGVQPRQVYSIVEKAVRTWREFFS